MSRPTIELSRLRVSCRDCSLSELCLPHALGSDEVERLDAIVKRGRLLDRGQRVFEAGDAFESLYVVRSGSLKSSMATPDGREQIVGFHLPGELVGLDGFGSGTHRCYAQALETTSVCRLPTDRIESLSHEVPGLDRALHRLMGREIGEEQALLLLLGKGTAAERLATFLISLSRRHAERGFSPTRFNLSMSRHEIGNYLGLALETVSRQFARLQSSGVLKVSRRAVTILELDALRGIAGEPGSAHPAPASRDPDRT